MAVRHSGTPYMGSRIAKPGSGYMKRFVEDAAVQRWGPRFVTSNGDATVDAVTGADLS